jgi:hypothetical protein
LQVADFDGMGMDILWWNTSTGENIVWDMDGATQPGRFPVADRIGHCDGG